VLVQRLRSGGWAAHDHGADGHRHAHHGAGHGHGDHHHHHHHHDHHHRDHGERLTRRGIVGVGVAAGLLPCPSALVVLLSAIALQRVGFGLALITAFSLGLAATITGIGSSRCSPGGRSAASPSTARSCARARGGARDPLRRVAITVRRSPPSSTRGRTGRGEERTRDMFGLDEAIAHSPGRPVLVVVLVAACSGCGTRPTPTTWRP
jgi:hypothetical protein